MVRGLVRNWETQVAGSRLGSKTPGPIPAGSLRPWTPCVRVRSVGASPRPARPRRTVPPVPTGLFGWVL